MNQASGSGGACAAILAAGSAKRFGGGKIFASLRGSPLIVHPYRSLMQLELPVTIVCRPEDSARIGILCPLTNLLANNAADHGMGTSIACAARMADAKGHDILLIALADMPFVTAGHFAALIGQVADGSGPIASQYQSGKLGVPAAFPSSSYPTLKQLTREGGDGLLENAEARSIAPEPTELFDVDTQNDLDIAEGLWN